MTGNVPPSAIATTATDAWNLLHSRGLEVPGRDSDLVQMLRDALVVDDGTSGPISFQGALAASSLEQFVRAFFDSAAPYVDMLKDILTWFEQAGAKEGPQGWKLAWDGGEIPELQHFRQWMAALAGPIQAVEHPALSFADCWRLIEKLTPAPAVTRTRQLIGKENYRALPASIADFAYGYDFDYEAISNLPPPGAAPAWMHSIWNIIRRALTEFSSRDMNRPRALACAKMLNYARTVDDGFALDSLCMLETDLWLLSLVASYGALLDSPADQAVVGAQIEAWFATIPVTTFLAADNIGALTAFLDLPLWGRRHEFFSAWIASKIIDGCGDHDLELLHESGVIALPFKKTELARVQSSRPLRVLFAERRSPLIDPIGDGRLANVQPDFSLWHTSSTDEVCDLVVEVKHYLSPARKSWTHVFEDYAAAHPRATVVLVNYGKGGNAIMDVSPAIRARCKLIGNLRPGHPDSIAQLTDAVRTAVGPVVPARARNPGSGAGNGALILVDRSHSTRVGGDALRAYLEQFSGQFGASHVGVAAVDAGLSCWKADAAGFDAIASFPKNLEIEFTGILLEKLGEFAEIVFLTDGDGDAAVDRTSVCVEDLGGDELLDMKVLRVTRHGQPS